MNTIQEIQEEHLNLITEKIKFLWELKLLRCNTCINELGPINISIDDIHFLTWEYVRLRDEYSRLASLINNNIGPFVRLNPSPSTLQNQIESGNYNPSCVGKFEGKTYSELSEQMPRPSDPFRNAKKPLITRLAEVSMDELVLLARSDEPFWTVSFDGTRMLNKQEYIKHFSRGIGVEQNGFNVEASKDTCDVDMNPIALVKAFMNLKQWIDMFSTICAKASIVEVIRTGTKDDYDGALLVMNADFQVPTPFVPRRNNYFARYCKNLKCGTWGVVDVSIQCEHSLHNGARYCRRPSGCLIQAQPNGRSKVTWVEHVEVDNSGIQYPYAELVNSCLVFGAKRWIASLQIHRLHLARLVTSNCNERTEGDVENDLMKVAHRMVASFCAAASATTAVCPRTEQFITAEPSRVHVASWRNVVDPGKPCGDILNVATSLMLPVPPKAVFDFLIDVNHRPKWDILLKNGEVSAVKQLVYGTNKDNSTSLLELKSESSVIPINIFLVQESCHDDTRSLVVYAPMEISTVNNIIHGENPAHIPILPSGFVVHPTTIQGCDNGSPGSLLTISFLFLVDTSPTAETSYDFVEDAKTMIISTAKTIRTALCEP